MLLIKSGTFKHRELLCLCDTVSHNIVLSITEGSMVSALGASKPDIVDGWRATEPTHYQSVTALS
jgi:hypothetical protein